jgi:hypothetical protein
MAMRFAVKTRLVLATFVCWSGLAGAEPVPDAREILRTVRLAQTSQHQTLRGRLRTAGKVSPFRLVIEGPIIRYEFSDPPQIIQLRLLERDSRLEEVTPGGTQRIAAARFDDTVRGSDITYEDLAMKFLYWPNANVEGEQTMLLRRCWKIRAEPSAKGDSQYRGVILWIDKASGALMQAEAFDATGKFARRFKVISGQKIEGAWLLKSMRIESAVGPHGEDRSPTYLEIEGVEKG